MHEITQYVEEFVERDMPGSGQFFYGMTVIATLEGRALVIMRER